MIWLLFTLESSFLVDLLRRKFKSGGTNFSMTLWCPGVLTLFCFFSEVIVLSCSISIFTRLSKISILGPSASSFKGSFKLHLTPKYCFCLNKSLHLFETHCAFLSLLNPNLDFLQAVKVTKPGHHLLHERASKGCGSVPGLTSQTSFHACLQRLTMMQIDLWRQTRNRPMPLTSSVMQQMMARFHNFNSL